MIEILKTVNLAVATKGLVPIWTHYHFHNNRVQGSNGILFIDAPLELGYDITVPAVKFYQAVKLCSKELKLKITDTGRLSIRCKKFRALINLAPHNSYPAIEFSSRELFTCKNIKYFLEIISPFVSDDASRPWSRSVIIKDGYAWATNNISLARIKVPYTWQTVIPKYMIEALLAIENEPTHINIEKTRVNFSYTNGVKLGGSLPGAEWPDVAHLIEVTEADAVPNYFKETLEVLLPFCEDSKMPIFVLGDEGVSTDMREQGAKVDLAKLPNSAFRAEPLLQVARIATHINFKRYPKSCYFTSNIGVDGVIMGIPK